VAFRPDYRAFVRKAINGLHKLHKENAPRELVASTIDSRGWVELCEPETLLSFLGSACLCAVRAQYPLNAFSCSNGYYLAFKKLTLSSVLPTRFVLSNLAFNLRTELMIVSSSLPAKSVTRFRS